MMMMMMVIIIIIIMCWRLVWKFSVGENDDDWCETTWWERERERRVCVMLLLTHYFVQWCICFTSSLLQTIGIHGMHIPLCLFDGWLLVVKVHSPIISSSFFIKKKLLGRFQRLSISKKIGCQVYRTKIWVIFQITGWEPLIIYIEKFQCLTVINIKVVIKMIITGWLVIKLVGLMTTGSRLKHPTHTGAYPCWSDISGWTGYEPGYAPL
jgi:hypothetical protein